MIVVSACLCGVNCRYDGGNNANKEITRLFKDGKAVLVCPEQLGGMETPRDPREIVGGSGCDVLDGKAKVLNKDGKDSTEEFLKGAEEALKIAKLSGADAAILKARSPSCGCGRIYDGSFTGGKIEGNGVTAELFLRNNIKVYSEENCGESLKELLIED